MIVTVPSSAGPVVALVRLADIRRADVVVPAVYVVEIGDAAPVEVEWRLVAGRLIPRCRAAACAGAPHACTHAAAVRERREWERRAAEGDS